MSDLSEMFKDMITRRPGVAEGSSIAVVSEDDHEGGGGGGGGGGGESGSSPQKKMKQTTLSFGVKSGPGAGAGGKSSGKGKGREVEVVLEGIEEEYPEPKGEYLSRLVKKLGGRKLRVATMCR